MKTLIVDDKQENLYLLKSILEAYGYKTISAKNGAEALGLAKKERPDLIIADILMPVMDGYTLCRECKKDDRLKSVPFIFYTATYTNPKDEEFALSLGADRFILKPQEPEVFIEIINNCMNDIKEGRSKSTIPADLPETIVLREYNQSLIRKLEDKMLQTEENEKKLKNYVRELEINIEERKKTEKALQESEERYRLVQENSMDAILLTLPDGSINSANRAACEMFQMSEKEICHLGRNGIVDGTDPRLSKLIEERKRTGKAQGELTLLRKDKSKFPAEITTSIFTDSGGKKKSSMIIRDITERKKGEEILRQHEQQLSSIYNTVADVIYYVAVEQKEQFRFISVNNAFSKVTGVPADQINGKLINEVIPEPSLGIVMEKYRTAIKGKEVVRWEETSDYPNGKLTGIVSIAPVYDDTGNCSHLVGSVHDITERKLTEEHLKNSEERFRSVWENSIDGMRITDKKGTIVAINDAYCKLVGVKKEAIVGKSFNMVYRSSDEDAKKATEQYMEKFSSRTIVPKKETDLMLQSGNRVSVEMSNAFLESESNEPLLLSIFRDITERKRAEEEMKKSREYFKNVFEHAAVGKSITSLDGTLKTNKTFCEIVGYSEEEFVNMNWVKITHPDDVEKNHQIIKSILSGEKLSERWEKRYIHKDGHIVFVDITTTLLRDTNEKPLYFITTIQDITKRKQAEKILQDQMDELKKFQHLTVGREMTMIELKKEVNELLKKTGDKEKYKIIS